MGQSFFKTSKALHCLCSRYHLTQCLGRCRAWPVAEDECLCVSRVNDLWGFISAGRVGKVMENQFKGPPLPLRPILTPLVQTPSTQPGHHGLFLSVDFAVNKEKAPLSDALVQGFSASRYLDLFTSLRRRGVAAQLGKIYTYFPIMENSSPDIELLTLICFLWKKRPAAAAAAVPQAGSLIWQQQQQRPLQPLPVNRG